MKWSICVVLLVIVVATAARMGVGVGKGKKMGFDSNLLTTIAKLEGQVEKRQLAEASWYCYELTTLAEETIAMSQVAIFAGGANKEGKKVEMGTLNLLTSNEDRSNGHYCAVTSSKMNEQHLTPNNDKIKYMTMDSMNFYSMKVLVRDPLSLLEGFNRLKATLARIGLAKKVQFDHPAVIYRLGEIGGEILYPED